MLRDLPEMGPSIEIPVAHVHFAANTDLLVQICKYRSALNVFVTGKHWIEYRCNTVARKQRHSGHLLSLVDL